MAAPTPHSLLGLAQDILVQIRGGQPRSDDDLLSERQVVEWLRRAAGGLLAEQVSAAENSDNPLADRWWGRYTLPLTELTDPPAPFGVSYFSVPLPTTPLLLAGLPLIRSVRIGATELVGPIKPTALHYAVRGYHRFQKLGGSYALAPLRPGTVEIQVAISELLAGPGQVTLEMAGSDPLAGVADTDELPVSRAFAERLVDRLMRGPVALTVRGVPDLTNNADGQPSNAPAL